MRGVFPPPKRREVQPFFLTLCFRSPAITYLGLSAGKFADLEQQDGPSIRDLFAKSATSQAPPPTLEKVTPSRPLTYFERLSQLKENAPINEVKAETSSIQAVQEEKSPVQGLQRDSSRRPSFFERRFEKVGKPEAVAPTEKEAEVEDQVEKEAEEAEAEAEAEVIYSESDFMACSECGSRVLIFHMPEHSDRHVAEQLQRDLQREMQEEAEAEAEGSRRKSEEKRPGKRRGRPPGSSKAKKAKEESAFTLDKFLR